VTHDQIEELLRGGVPSEDPFAKERARIRLRALMMPDEKRPGIRRRSRLAAFAAASLAVAVVLLVLQLLLPIGPAGPQLSAAAEIRQLGRISTNQARVEMGSSDVMYHRYDEAHREESVSTTSGTKFAIDVQVEIETWVASDGSGRTVTTYQDVAFPTLSDHEGWEQAGSTPAVGDVVPQRASAGDLPLYHVDKLPTDPSALLGALNDGSVIEPAPGDINVLSTIGTLLAQQDLPDDLRQALFDVAASLPGVAVERDVQDHGGRPAVAVSVTDGSTRTRLFFDPSDASFLGRDITYPSDGDRPGAIEWRAYLDSGIVSAIGERPSS
jgi:hypothetical protein